MVSMDRSRFAAGVDVVVDTSLHVTMGVVQIKPIKLSDRYPEYRFAVDDFKLMGKETASDLPGYPSNDEVIWVITGMHTGTHFLLKNIEEIFRYRHLTAKWHNSKVIEFSPSDLDDDQRGYYAFSHIGFNPYWFRVETERCVTTIRNPVECFRTYMIRYPWSAELCESYIHILFRDIYSIAFELSSHIFQVDAEDMETEVSMLSDYLRIEDYDFIEFDRNIRTRRKLNRGLPKPPNSVCELAEKIGYEVTL